MSEINIDELIAWTNAPPICYSPEADAVRVILEQHRNLTNYVVRVDKLWADTDKRELELVRAFVERVRRRYEQLEEDDYCPYERCLDDELEELEKDDKDRDEYKTATD